MYGLTRAGTTLIGAAVAGFLFWVGTRIVTHPFSFQGTSKGDYWLWLLTLAAAGFVMALSQLLGGWTKWGWPTISVPVLVIGFVPPLIVGLWILAFHQPGRGWGAGHVRSWSNDIGVFHAVSTIWIAVPAIAFLLGLLFGFSFDTSGPRVARAAVVRRGRGAGAAASSIARRASSTASPRRSTTATGDGRHRARTARRASTTPDNRVHT